MPEEQSLSADNLPGWIKPVWPQVSASLCAFYGAEENPWVLDRNEEDPAHFDNVLKVLLDALFPEKHYIADSSDQVYKIARQAIYNWRRAFANSARAAVKQAVKARHGNPRQVTRESVAAWAKSANSHRGEAHWENPDTRKDGEPSGALQSRYMLQSFAGHVRRTEKSLFKNLGLPIGALTLACTAVDYAFRHYYTGVEAAPKGLRRFDYDTVGHMMEEWYELTVKPLADTKPHRFKALVARAREWGRAQAVSNESDFRSESTQPERRRPVLDRDSSPALPE